MKYFEKNGKRGQIAIWVIVALIIAVSIVFFFILRRGPSFAKGAEFSPEQYMETCVASSVNEVTEKMIPQAGLLEPENYIIYNRSKAPYMCEDTDYFTPCINQHSMLLNEIKGEIYDYIKPRIENCFSTMKAEAEKEQIGVELEAMTFEVAIAPKRVIVNINRKTVLREQEETRTVDSYRIDVQNPIYDLGNVVLDIVSSEAKYCSFDALAYMIRYRRFNIQNTVLDDSTKIYFVKDNESGKRMMFAIRGCAMPDL
jgi:sulfur carrier protein ThiS